MRKASEGKILTFWRQRQDECFHVRAKRRQLDRQLENAYRKKNHFLSPSPSQNSPVLKFPIKTTATTTRTLLQNTSSNYFSMTLKELSLKNTATTVSAFNWHQRIRKKRREKRNLSASCADVFRRILNLVDFTTCFLGDVQQISQNPTSQVRSV